MKHHVFTWNISGNKWLLQHLDLLDVIQRSRIDSVFIIN